MTGTPAVRAHRQAPSGLSLVEICEIARDAYIYGYPLVDGYRRLHAWFVDRDHHDYTGAWNRIHATPSEADRVGAVLGLDLRREPQVLTVPRVEAGRYYAVQGNDLYSHIFGHIGTRTSGNGPGHFLIAGPHWQGKAARAVTEVIHCDTELALLTFHLPHNGAVDLAKAEKTLAGCQVVPLSRFLGLPPPMSPSGDFLTPLSLKAERNSLSFFNELNFVLTFCPLHDSERDLMARFARLGIGSHTAFDAGAFSPEARLAIDDGMADAWKAVEAARRRRPADNQSERVRGSRSQMKGNYLNRMIGALEGLWTPAAEEMMTHDYLFDAEHQRLDGTYHHYALHISGNALPPVNAFWTVTVNQAPTGAPLAGHLDNSAFLSDVARESDGGLTLYIQREPIGGAWAANWLPAPAGPFMLRLNLYWPQAEALTGVWPSPPLIKVH